MAIKRPKASTKSKPASEADIEKVIEKGGGVPNTAQSSDKPDVKFQMVIPADICEQIDADRGPSKTSRRAWLLQRAIEYLNAEK